MFVTLFYIPQLMVMGICVHLPLLHLHIFESYNLTFSDALLVRSHNSEIVR